MPSSRAGGKREVLGGADLGKRRDAPSIVLPHQAPGFISHIAIDIGGSLIKLVYFSPEDSPTEAWDENGKPRNHAGGMCGLQRHPRAHHACQAR
jgi:hypothetical protein